MLMQGVNVKVAQERLGHKDISTTLNIYSHVLPSSAREAAEKIGEMVKNEDNAAWEGKEFPLPELLKKLGDNK
jgi:hypothetical protein